MYKRLISIIFFINMVIVLARSHNIIAEPISIFPRGNTSWVGDPMPYFDGKHFSVFYLEDLRDGDVGFHPWGLLTTDNLYEYKNQGIVILYSKNTSAQDLALGTGSVIKDKDGVYHAFYTGHNSGKQKAEAIMHATSKDMKTWTKQPKDTFYSDEEYSQNDFRDPYVLYNEKQQQYWMLITTRTGNIGVIALYTSKDLIKWSDKGVLFENDMGSDANMECSTLIKYGDYWYLTFSDQWPSRVVHYRIAASPDGPFKKSKLDHFDGTGFYAGRLETDKKNLFLFGWTPTKVNYDDIMNYDWAGNLVVHQLKQRTNGELYPIPVQNIVDKLNAKKSYKAIPQTNTIKSSKEGYLFSGKGYENISFGAIQGINKITGEFQIKSKVDKFGFQFSLGRDGKNGRLNIVFNGKTNQLEFYNTETDEINDTEPQSVMPLSIKAGKTLKFTVLIEDSVTVVYVNDEVVLSSRMFCLQKNSWGIFSMNSNITLNNLEIHGLINK